MRRFISTERSKFTRSPFEASGSDLVTQAASEGGGGGSGGGGGTHSGEVIGLLVALTYP